METYISLVSYTGEGVQHMDESPERLDAARDVVAKQMTAKDATKSIDDAISEVGKKLH